ncbi:MAG TPA: single-stranded DNA-binding protein [Solirubrobacterales bacterium]|nr:single-stranded DNA-binding protein [Solirubrobacterales bacterium]
MAASNVNVVVITGNLTKDPELRSTGGGTSVCEMRVAVNSRRKDQSGQWVDKPNYFDVVVFGAQGENCANYLSRGRPVAVEGRLDWREWEAKEGGGKRQAVQIIANSVQFLGSRDGGGAPNGNGGGQGQGNQGYGNQGNQGYGGGGQNQSYGAPAGDVPADESDFGPVSTGGGPQEDDIPF